MQIAKLRDNLLRFFSEPPSADGTLWPKLKKMRSAGQFVWLVISGFKDNRCPVRAAALSYTTLLALVPLLAVIFTFSKGFLREESETVVPQILDKVITVIAPQLELMPMPEQFHGPPAPEQSLVSTHARQEVVQKIQSFLDNINSGAISTASTILLILVAIRLLMTVEAAFNDIWGVLKGRSIWKKLVYYWTTICLATFLLIAIALTGGLEFSPFLENLSFAPWIQKALLHLSPFVILWIAFSLLYVLMPNTTVQPKAAIIGGIAGGTLWQVNNLLSTLYVSRVVSYSKIYGALGILPVLLVGLYFSWMIILFGAQISYTVQNVRHHFQQRAAEFYDQIMRELTACRIVLASCHSFIYETKTPTIQSLAENFQVPLTIINQLVAQLIDGKILSELSGDMGALQPARPPNSITVTDVLTVSRTHTGKPTSRHTPDFTSDVIATTLSELQQSEQSSESNISFSELAAKHEKFTNKNCPTVQI